MVTPPVGRGRRRGAGAPAREAGGGGDAVRRRDERGRRGGGRCAEPTARRSRSTCRGWIGCSTSTRSRSRRARAGHLRARAGAAAGARRADAGALPAVVRVLHRRGLGGHALGRARPRPATGASTSWWSRVRCETPGGRARAPATCRPPPPARRCASWWWARRACSGVITAATLRVRPLPQARHYEALVVPSFAEGAEAFRAAGAGRRVAGRGAPVRRGGDAAVDGAVLQRRRRGARRPRLPARCAATRAAASRSPASRARRTTVARRRGRTAGVLRAARCASRSGSGPGRSWLRGRFAAPYLRDEMLDRGVMVETLETATTWSNLHCSLRGGRSGRCETRSRPAARRPP